MQVTFGINGLKSASKYGADLKVTSDVTLAIGTEQFMDKWAVMMSRRMQPLSTFYDRVGWLRYKHYLGDSE